MVTELVSRYLDEHGCLKAYPSKRKYKNASLMYIASKIEADKQYKEKEICEIIDSYCCFQDSAWLRREMFGMGFLGRTYDGSNYWKEAIQPSYEKLELEQDVLAILVQQRELGKLLKWNKLDSDGKVNHYQVETTSGSYDIVYGNSYQDEV